MDRDQVGGPPVECNQGEDMAESANLCEGDLPDYQSETEEERQINQDIYVFDRLQRLGFLGGSVPREIAQLPSLPFFTTTGAESRESSPRLRQNPLCLPAPPQNPSQDGGDRDMGSSEISGNQDLEMEGGNQWEPNQADWWEEWASSVDGKLNNLHGRLSKQEQKQSQGENLPNISQVMEGVNHRVSQGQEQIVQMVSETLSQNNSHVFGQLEQQRQKMEMDLSQTVNNFILQCQQGGEMVQNLAQIQKKSPRY